MRVRSLLQHHGLNLVIDTQRKGLVVAKKRTKQPVDKKTQGERALRNFRGIIGRDNTRRMVKRSQQGKK